MRIVLAVPLLLVIASITTDAAQLKKTKIAVVKSQKGPDIEIMAREKFLQYVKVEDFSVAPLSISFTVTLKEKGKTLGLRYTAYGENGKVVGQNFNVWGLKKELPHNIATKVTLALPDKTRSVEFATYD